MKRPTPDPVFCPRLGLWPFRRRHRFAVVAFRPVGPQSGISYRVTWKCLRCEAEGLRFGVTPVSMQGLVVSQSNDRPVRLDRVGLPMVCERSPFRELVR